MLSRLLPIVTRLGLRTNLRYNPLHRFSTAVNTYTTQSLPPLDTKLQITFTCTAPTAHAPAKCSHRSTHQFSKKSYEKGLVIIQCPSCLNRHLIADNLGWFKDGHEPRNIEDMLKARGEHVQRGTIQLEG